MNWLAHFWLADATGTSLCGQFLGDWVKGRDLSVFEPPIARGIRLHRAIDSISDSQPEYKRLRRCLSPSIRRYAPILLDIAFDYSLARHWPTYSNSSLADYTAAVESRIVATWPSAGAPFSARKVRGLATVLASYQSASGIRRALTDLERRLSRPAPLRAAFDELHSLSNRFDGSLAPLLKRLEHRVSTLNRRLSCSAYEEE